MKWIILCAIVAVAACTVFPILALQSKELRTEERPEYTIEYLTPIYHYEPCEMRLTLKTDPEVSDTLRLAKAIIDIQKRYHIILIDPKSSDPDNNQYVLVFRQRQ